MEELQQQARDEALAGLAALIRPRTIAGCPARRTRATPRRVWPRRCVARWLIGPRARRKVASSTGSSRAARARSSDWTLATSSSSWPPSCAGPTDVPRDDGAILAHLNAAGVDYVVIGGWAVIAHGYVRATRDIDVLVADTPAIRGQVTVPHCTQSVWTGPG